MIREVTLTNFQGFKGVQSVRLAPITLIFGPNSAGKSSIGRALRLLKQSNSGLDYIGSEVDLGHLQNAVFGQGRVPSVDRLGISIKVDPIPGTMPDNCNLVCAVTEHFTPDSISDYYNPTHVLTAAEYKTADGSTETLSFESSVEGLDQDIHVSDAASLEELIWTAAAKDNNIIFRVMQQLPPESDHWDFEDLLHLCTHFEPLGNVNVITSIDEEEFADHTEDLTFVQLRAERLEAFWGNVTKSILDNLNAIRHVVPLRETPKRVELNGQLVNLLGNRAFDAVLTNEWLGKLTGNRYLFTSKRHELQEDLAEPLRLTSNYVTDLYTGAIVGFDDLGTGIGQVLPVLQALCPPRYSSARGQILLVEQPELHLHPAMQSGLFDAIQDAVNSRRVSQVILETHSEAMLLRLQRAIRKGELKPEDATVVFVEPSPMNPEDPRGQRSNLMYNIEFREDGELESSMPLTFAGLRLTDLID